MKQHIEKLLQIALAELQQSGALPAIPAFVQVDAPKNKQYGDYASNVALILAKVTQKKPHDIANEIIKKIPSSAYLQKIEIAGAGFINFFLLPEALHGIVARVLTEKESFGRCTIGCGKRILLEFVSSNPTGPLHVGHGRHAAFGIIVANLLDAVGFKTFREYYVNDIGRQMDILTTSVWLRYLQICGEDICFPANAYHGDYIKDIARAIHLMHRNHFYAKANVVMNLLPKDEQAGGDKENYIDALIERTKDYLGHDKYSVIFNLTVENILADIREDLTDFGVHYDNWFFERQFMSNNIFDELIEKLRATGFVYELDGALWFNSKALGDEKDRVLVRSNGKRTYFANDVAYHLTKFDRGFDLAIDIFGADHHGYIPRMKAAMQALGVSPERLQTLLVQFVTLYRGDKQVSMSMRDGNFVTLRQLREEVGNDVARFFYVMKRCDHHMDFDLELAKANSNENPVYYIQYAYARIKSVFKQLSERAISYDEAEGIKQVVLLTDQHEQKLIHLLARYPDMIVEAALRYEPHLLTNYLIDLASTFHAYYNSQPFLEAASPLRDARLALIAAVSQTLLNSFHLLDINAPDSM